MAYRFHMRWLPLFLSFAFTAVSADTVMAAKPVKKAVKGRVAAKKAVAAPKAKKKRSKKMAVQNSVRPDEAMQKQRWQTLQQMLRPTALLTLCDEFARDFPDSRYGPELKDIQAGAQSALAAQRAARLSSDALEEADGSDAYRAELVKALRGDKNAAHRIAAMYRQGSDGLPRNELRAEQWLYFAAELGNGVASWQLAETLNIAGQWSEAAKYERKSIELGFRPPARLPTKGMNF